MFDYSTISESEWARIYAEKYAERLVEKEKRKRIEEMITYLDDVCGAKYIEGLEDDNFLVCENNVFRVVARTGSKMKYDAYKKRRGEALVYYNNRYIRKEQQRELFARDFSDSVIKAYRATGSGLLQRLRVGSDD